jgi:heptosyltransferase-2
MHKKFENIVVFMPRFIGDCINCTPALELVIQQYPTAKISLIIQPLASEVFNRERKVSCILDNRKKNKVKGTLFLIKQIKNKRFDACILLTNKLADALIAKISGINTVVGYDSEFRGSLLTHKAKMDQSRHYINRYAYVANLLCNNEHKILPEVSIFHDVSLSKIAHIKNIKIGFCILGKNKLPRHYPPNLTAKVIKLITQNIKNRVSIDASFFIFGAKDESPEADEVTSLCNNSGIKTVSPCTGIYTIEELIDTIADLDLLITVDSGPLHIAAAVNTVTIALQSKGTSPFSNVCPKGKQVTVINNAGNYINDNDQILDISPKLVSETAIKLLLSNLNHKPQ